MSNADRNWLEMPAGTVTEPPCAGPKIVAGRYPLVLRTCAPNARSASNSGLIGRARNWGSASIVTATVDAAATALTNRPTVAAWPA